MIQGIAPRATITVVRLDERATSTGTRDEVFRFGSPTMQLKMALSAKSYAIRYIVAKLRIGGVWLDMMCGQSSLILATPAMTVLTDVGITLQHSCAPLDISWFGKPFPGFAAFPLIMTLAFRRPVLEDFRKLCTCLGRRFASQSLSTQALAQIGRDLAFFCMLLLDSPTVFRSFFQASLGGPLLDRDARDTEWGSQLNVRCRRICSGEVRFVHVIYCAPTYTVRKQCLLVRG
jgi:hypothetical protein